MKVKWENNIWPAERERGGETDEQLGISIPPPPGTTQGVIFDASWGTADGRCRHRVSTVMVRGPLATPPLHLLSIAPRNLPG